MAVSNGGGRAGGTTGNNGWVSWAGFGNGAQEWR